LFIPQATYEQEEQWWNDINMRKLLFRPAATTGNPTSSNLVANLEELAKEIKLA
jgi:hypothetical protein